MAPRRTGTTAITKHEDLLKLQEEIQSLNDMVAEIITLILELKEEVKSLAPNQAA